MSGLTCRGPGVGMQALGCRCQNPGVETQVSASRCQNLSVGSSAGVWDVADGD